MRFFNWFSKSKFPAIDLGSLTKSTRKAPSPEDFADAIMVAYRRKLIASTSLDSDVLGQLRLAAAFATGDHHKVKSQRESFTTNRWGKFANCRFVSSYAIDVVWPYLDHVFLERGVISKYAAYIAPHIAPYEWRLPKVWDGNMPSLDKLNFYVSFACFMRSFNRQSEEGVDQIIQQIKAGADWILDPPHRFLKAYAKQQRIELSEASSRIPCSWGQELARLAMSLAWLGQSAEAERLFRVAVDSNPNNDHVNNYRKMSKRCPGDLWANPITIKGIVVPNPVE